MNIGGIDSSRIEAMMAQLKAAATKPSAGASAAGGTGAAGAAGGLGNIGGIAKPGAADASSKVSFSDALKAQLDNVSKAQLGAEDMGKRFASGDDSVSLSDTMIAMQKASISFQATVQVRNKLVSAYQSIMNMQV
ncbi:flagellar hook-basal body complex protein FliE [Massilia sp. YIM B02763]|uniref:flagellar hook-basal body complex protein FliE n=1 Tax=Massilia sp. YIM B02763 TaxID=3050130 RepID=UPI0025B64EC1|nr:flagellar hook-basal body complex protein FliE [Massilia sp. YIM B02763]MDN4052652.1 flagellar hook-basal body complex protein FliE [Massilia sp. YIM B02763]